MNHDNIKLDLVDFDYDGDTVIGDYTVTVSRDHNPQNPRTEWDNLGRMVCWHNRYNLGDNHGFETPDVFMHVLSGLYPEEATEDLTKEQRERCYAVVSDRAILLPLYLYDHSGITMKTAPFSDQWDSGQVGYIYITKEDVRKEFSVSRISPKLAKRVVAILKAEVETNDHYLTDNVYGYRIVKNVSENEIEIDSCWGFYGNPCSGIEAYIRESIAYDIAATPQQLELA
jgi:hypothetical protein